MKDKMVSCIIGGITIGLHLPLAAAVDFFMVGPAYFADLRQIPWLAGTGCIIGTGLGILLRFFTLNLTKVGQYVGGCIFVYPLLNHLWLIRGPIPFLDSVLLTSFVFLLFGSIAGKGIGWTISTLQKSGLPPDE